jgi:hypothetical protein
VQPELGKGQERARHLMLLLFGHNSPHLERAVLRDFMGEFYRALAVADPERDGDFKAMLEAQGNFFFLADFEAPVLDAADVAFCLHYVETTAMPLKRDEECPVFRSMELDLLSYAFQSLPPFQTACESLDDAEVDRAKDYGIDIEIEYPVVTTYQSEGRRHYLYCADRRRALKAYVACTRFLGSRVAVWHVTLRPTPGAALNEFDLIKLAKLYGTRTEETSLLGVHGVRFRRKDGKSDVDAMHLPGLLGFGTQVRKLAAGTIEWIVADDAAEGVVKRLARLSDATAVAKLAEDADSDIAQSRELKALCGVITGILDFSEIGGAEAGDTLAPTYMQPGTYIRVHRATFLQVCDGDRAMQAVLGTAGISPYLIIPHSAVLFNEELLADAQAASEQLGSGTKQLEDRHATMNRNLRKTWLQNVFAYRTERTLFTQALTDRGAIDRYAALRQRAQEIETLIERRWNTRHNGAQIIISVLLAFLSVLQVRDALYDIFPEQLPKGLGLLLAAIVVAVVVGLVGLLSLRRR